MNTRRTKAENGKWGDAGINLVMVLQFTKPIFEEPFARPYMLYQDQGFFWWNEPNAGGQVLAPTVSQEDCLDQFLRLAIPSASENHDDVEQFVRRYGILGLWPARREHEGKLWLGDSIDLYRRLAKQARSILLVAAGLYAGNGIEKGLWQEMSPQSSLPTAPISPVEDAPKISVDQQVRQGIIDAVRVWTISAPVFLQLWWETENVAPQVRLTDEARLGSWNEDDYQKSAKEDWQSKDIRDMKTFMGLSPRRSRLFSILTIQLVAALSSPLYSCDICGTPFGIGRRKPQAKRSKLCNNPDCQAQRKRELSRSRYENSKGEKR